MAVIHTCFDGAKLTQLANRTTALTVTVPQAVFRFAAVWYAVWLNDEWPLR